MGHEVVATVEALGPGTAGIEPGTRVTGRIMQGYAEYTLASVGDLIPVPESLSDAAAMVEPYVCQLSGIRRLGVHNSGRIAVISAGYMGLGLTRLLKLMGAGHVTVLDLNPALFKKAIAMGADATLRPQDAEGLSFDTVFEAAGSQSALHLAGTLCRRYGTLGLLGYHPCTREIDMSLWAAKALTAVNIFEYRRENELAYMREALSLAESGKLPTGGLVTHRFPLSRITRAFETHSSKAGGYIKGIIDDFLN
jgi:threonine dehydrogenase-like Zn-dependent dehydrogenase